MNEIAIASVPVQEWKDTVSVAAGAAKREYFSAASQAIFC